jgi:hypothetical protein
MVTLAGYPRNDATMPRAALLTSAIGIYLDAGPSGHSYKTGCLEGRFAQGVNLHVPSSEVVRVARG